jgi:cell division protein FtsW (lipid II flippase)
MTNWFKDNTSIIWSWAALIAVAAIICGVSRSTQFASFGIGLLTASVALLVAVAVFEAVWQAAVHWLSSAGNGQAPPRSTPKHRQRGQ